MATLEKIRSKGGVFVAIFIGLALAAFILTDLMSSGPSIFSGNQTEVLNINGKSIGINEFQNKISEMEEFNKLNTGATGLTEEETYSLREQIKEMFISQALLEERYEQLGIAVTSEEVLDMVTGRNIHPSIYQHPLFADPGTGIFDPQRVMSFLQNKNVDPTAYFYWMVMEEQLINEKLFIKYGNLLKKGMYMPTALKNQEIAARSKSVDFDFVGVRLSTVADSLITVSEKEVKDYYNKNKKYFKREATRDIEYITFAIEPTDADRTAALEWVNKLIGDFSSPEVDPIQFVNLNSDIQYIGRNQRLAEFSSQVQDFILSAKVGDVFGPYFEDNAYKASRLVAINNMPDSARARHILIRETTPDATNALADSLMDLIRKGADFADLARRYSQDPGSAINGGDLGWFTEGMMVPEFNDAVFKGKTGDLVKTQTQYGIHIINIQQQGPATPKYNLATLVREIHYSSETYQDVYRQAARFAADNNTPEKFNQAIEEGKLVKRYGRSIRENDNYVGGFTSARELVRWAFETNVGSMSPVFEFDDQFVIANLVNAVEEGYASVNEVSPQITAYLKQQKKAELLAAQIEAKLASGASFETIAADYNTEVETVNGLSFSDIQVPGAGVEPALVSAAVNTPAGQISKPVKGNNGVYVLKVNNVETVEVSEDLLNTEFAQNTLMTVDYQLIRALRNDAEIKDRRARFY